MRRGRVGHDPEELDAHVRANLEADAPAVEDKVHDDERLQKKDELKKLKEASFGDCILARWPYLCCILVPRVEHNELTINEGLAVEVSIRGLRYARNKASYMYDLESFVANLGDYPLNYNHWGKVSHKKLGASQ